MTKRPRSGRASGKGGATAKVKQGPKRAASRQQPRGKSNGGTTDTTTRTFWDPKKRCLVDAKGNKVTAQPDYQERVRQETDRVNARVTAQELAEPPKPLAYAMRLYACETADDATMTRLAALAGLTVAELEYRRRGANTMAGVPLAETWCGRTTWVEGSKLPDNRRACQHCPFWAVCDDDLPF